jgi:hypothetical protein
MWVVPIVLPIVLLVVPLGLEVFESRLLSPVQPQSPEAPGATVSSGAAAHAVSLEPVASVRATASRVASTTDPRLPAPRLRAVPRPASAHVAVG